MTTTAPVKVSGHSPLWPGEPPALRLIDSPARLTVPLTSRAGVEVQPKPPGTHVAAGESLVLQGDELAHVPVAPMAGIVGELTQAILTSGRTAAAVELAVDPGKSPAAPNKKIAPADTELVNWIDRLRDSGVWADRCESPDLIGQLHVAMLRPMEMVLCTLLDADSGMRLNGALAARYAETIVEAAAMLGRVTLARSVYLAVEEIAAEQWVLPIRQAAEKASQTPGQIKVIDLANDYPQSDPTLMLYSIADRRLRPGTLPATQGVVLLDAPAAWAVGQAMAGEANRFTPVAVHDHLQHQTHFVSVPIGTRLDDLCQALKIPTLGVIFRGGDLLRDIRIPAQAVLGGGELTIHITARELPNNPEPCVRCGWCLDACPTRVQPAAILDAAQRQDRVMAEKAGIHACIECGLCSHVCPSRLPLLEAVRHLRRYPVPRDLAVDALSDAGI
jgi:Na+-translocating ferredoxin:NAD+ oxidoreductase subunit C